MTVSLSRGGRGRQAVVEADAGDRHVDRSRRRARRRTGTRPRRSPGSSAGRRPAHRPGTRRRRPRGWSPSPARCSAIRAAAAAGTRLGDLARRDQPRRHDHVEPALRGIAEGHPDLVLPLATGGHGQVARLAGLEQVDGLRRHVGGRRRRLRTGRRRGRRRDWAVAADPPSIIIPPRRPAADQARTRQRCRQSIALEPFWTGPTAEGRCILPLPPRPESPPKREELTRFLILTAHHRNDTPSFQDAGVAARYSSASRPNLRPKFRRSSVEVADPSRMTPPPTISRRAWLGPRVRVCCRADEATCDFAIRPGP